MLKVGDVVKFEFSDCCLKVSGQGKIEKILVDSFQDVTGIVVNGVLIGGGNATNWGAKLEELQGWEVIEDA